uniref:RNA-directed DNA polymerase n=1 Tax=Fagus sylvatica TaxID=28930 RepID=A0A2N9FUQ4_FAGSY
MPPKTRQRKNQREVSVHTEHSHAESAINARGQDQPQPPPSDQNREVPPTNLLLELIQNLQQNQSELAEAIKQLKEKDAATKTPPQNEGRKSKKSLIKTRPYPEKYVAPTFSRFDGRKGSALVHISKFIDSMGAYAGNGDLCLREFSKSLDDRAYTWYTTLPPGSVKAWEDMEPPPPVPCTLEEIMAILDKWVADGIIKLPEISKKATEEDKKNPKFCYFHQYVHHSTADCWTLRRKFHEKIQDGTLELPQVRQKVNIDPFLKHQEKGAVSVVIHGNASDVDTDEPIAANSAMTPAAVKTLQRNPRFRSLFNQLGLNPEARTAATEAIMAIAADSGAHCFTAETHASRAFLETTNAITFTDEDMEVQYPDHRRPLYLSATINEVQVRRALVDTGSCINLIPLSTIQAAEISQKKDPRSTYGDKRIWWCRLNGKPIRIAANSTPFDQSESHFVEAALYDEITPAGEASLAKPIGIPLPKWEEIKDAPEADLRDLLERKKRHKAEASTSKSQPQRPPEPGEGIFQPSCLTVNTTDVPESADTAEPVTADPKISAKEELEVINLSSDPNVHRPVSISASLSVEERMHLVELLKEYQDVFAWQYDEMPGIDPKLVAHSLNVEPGTRPVVQSMRTFHPEVEAQITQEVKKLLSAGFIKPIQHPRWLSNIVPVKKKNGQIRCCVDFRNLNKACPKDEFPLPNMDLLIDSAAGHAMFSFMDGFSGYNQIFMSPKDAEKTAFRTPIGNFYYTVMPFGLKNAGATYQRTMTAMFHDMMHREIEDYVDDIVVKSKTREDHFSILKKVFERCRLYKLKMNPLKCAFGVSAGKFLGFLVHQRGIDVDPAKASAIATMKPPTTHKELKSFLGKLSYIRRFIPGLAAVQDIMTKLPTVCAPISGKPLRLYLASNSRAIGALIAQENDNGVEQPIYYVSRTLKDAESRYSGAERSCLALIYASQRLRHYFLAHKVQLMTKSHPIRSLLQRPVLSGRLAQWLLQLSQYEIIAETPTAIKSQAIADLLAQFPGEDNSFITDEVPGEINEIFLAGLADSVWTLKFDGSSTATSAGAGIVLCKEDGEAVTKSFKFDFPCSNNAAEYEAYLAGLAIAYEMGIKHLRVIGDSNLVKFEAKFSTFEIEHAQRNENRYADALATLGSQITFEGEEMDVTICKKMEPITETLKKEFEEPSSDQEDWRAPIKAKLISPTSSKKQRKGCLKSMRKLVETEEAISLYRRLQRLGYFWPNMSAEAAEIQSQCPTCQFHYSNEEVCATFVSTDWRTPFLEYLLEGILPSNPKDVYRLKRLALRYFVEGGTLFRKGFHGEPLRCLSLSESQMVMKETHAGEYFVKTCHTCQVQANLIHTHPTSLQNMATPWPFHTWGLDLIGPINPASGGYIWILVATEYFTKWVEAIPLRKATGAAVANFIREHIITRFGIPYKLITDNGTPFINKDVREVLEHYRVKHRRSTPYYPQGNGQAEATNRMLLRILSKMVFDYGNDWKAHLADVLWAYRSSPKDSNRVMQGSELEVDANICAEARMADLEGLDEARDLAKAKSQRNYQKMANVYSKALRVRIFAEGQMVLKAAEFVRRNLPSPSKFSPNWDGPYIIREAHGSGYYRLSKSDGTALADPINGKWLKHYYS